MTYSSNTMPLVSPKNSAGLSLRTQCELLGISRGAYYYELRPESAENLAILRRLDELHLERPVFGSWHW
jgi:hypothetical protein